MISSDSQEIHPPFCIKKLDLENGTTLEILDGSRIQAGDRYLVRVIFRLTIPVNDQVMSNGKTPVEMEDVIKMIGNPVVFEKRIERNFIDRTNKTSLIDRIVNDFLNETLKYICNPVFTRNYVFKLYSEAVKRSAWYSNQG